MFEISNISVAPLGESQFVKPMEIHYTLNGISKKWDYIQIHSGVAIIIFNVTRNVFILVKQFRPAVYIQNIPQEDQTGVINCKKYPVELGITLEFCAGIIDKKKSVEEIAVDEVMEETGYEISANKLEKIRVFNSTVGASADKVHLFYVEVEDHMKKGKGGGLGEEAEFIEIVELPLQQAEQICQDTTFHHAGFLYGLMWFFHYKLPTMNITTNDSNILK